MVRNNQWLAKKLDKLWQRNFSDVKKVNSVRIIFGRFARFRFGSITFKKTGWRKGSTTIRITGLFQDVKVPVPVVEYTIAHELCHYAQGFSSPHPKLHKYPHEGGVVHREIEKRGLEKLILEYKKWVKDYREELRKERGWR
jgi:hypothetical protein